MNKLVSSVKNFRITRKVFAYPYILFMMVFVVVPLVMLLVNAFTVNDVFSMENFKLFFSSDAYLRILRRSIIVGLATTGICLLIGYPAAYFLSKYSTNKVIALLFILPMWINFLIRTLAMRSVFMTMDWELGMTAVMVGMVYNYLPFMILPLHTTLSNIDKSYYEAAQDLGSSDFRTFLKVTVPLSVPGILSGITMVVIPAISTFAITELLGGANNYLFGDAIKESFSYSTTWGVGSVMSLIMLLFVLISNFVMNKFNKNETGAQVW